MSLGVADDSALESGVGLRRYDLPLFTRASGSGRVVEAAKLVIRGYRGRGKKGESGDGGIDVIIPEGQEFNNTLCVHNCPAFARSHAGEKERERLLPFLQDGVSRLNGLIRPHPQFEAEDIVHIAEMCGFDTALHGWSSWCGVLTGREWDAVGYIADSVWMG